MTRKVEGPVASFEAGEDLSTTAKAYTFVSINSSSKAVSPTSISHMPLGVLQVGGETGQECSVQIQGIAKVVLGATIAANVLVGPEATSGKAIAAAAGASPAGLLITGGDEDELGEMLILSSTLVA